MSVDVQERTVASSIAASGIAGVDPRRRRFGINPGIFNMEMDSRSSGWQEPVLPTGLIPFRTASLASENFEILDANPNDYQKQVIKDYPAAWFISNVKTRYEEYGFRELPSLTPLDDPARNEKGKVIASEFSKSAQGYFAAIYPALSELGIVCPMGMDACVTCRLEALGDEDSVPDALAKRIAKLPDPGIGEQLRLEIRNSVSAYREWCVWKWSMLTGELAKRRNGEPGIATLDESGHHVRKHLHEARPEDQSALTAASYGAQVASATAEANKELAGAFREGSTANEEVLKGIVETQKQQGEVLAKLTEFLALTAKANKKPE